MKSCFFVLAGILSSTAFASTEQITAIESFECHQPVSMPTVKVWTEKTASGQIITLERLGKTGVEWVEKFLATRIDTDDTALISSDDGAVALFIENNPNGNSYPGKLSFDNDASAKSVEVLCQETHIPDPT